MDSLTILVMGKGGVGKSSTVNSLIGERAVSISPFQVCFSCNLVLHGFFSLFVNAFGFFVLFFELIFLFSLKEPEL